jgi:hypothetical protein
LHSSKVLAYNYQRGASEAMEDHIHQIEAVLNYVDARERTPPEKWSEPLFWGKFVGSDRFRSSGPPRNSSSSSAASTSSWATSLV